MINLQEFWTKWAEETMRPPQSFDQMRRHYLKTVSKEELWAWHDEITEELKKR